MRPISVDFETFYTKDDYSVTELGNWRYCHDLRFDPFLISVYDGTEGWVGQPKDFNWAALEGAKLIAHNAAFDSSIAARLHEQGLAPALPNWQCSANLTSYVASTRSLDQAIQVLEGRRISKAVRDEMNGKNWDDLVKTGRDGAAAQYALGDAIECFNLWQKYSPIWPTFEQDLSSLTMKQCARGVAIDVEKLDKYRFVLQEVIFNLVKGLPWTERGGKPTSPIAINEECRKNGIPGPPFKTKDEEGFSEWERTYGPRFPWVYAAGQWRSLGKLLSSLNRVKERLRPDNTIDFSLLYFGAHTGRWSGGGSGLNLQNLRKVPLYIKNGNLTQAPSTVRQKDMAAWVAANVDFVLDIRSLFIARPGKKFILSDLAQIEPRILAWMTGNLPLMEKIRGGMSIYEAFARDNMGWTGGELKKENPDLYQLNKAIVLGLGFGCGWQKFQGLAASDYDVILSDEQAKETVSKFRETNPAIVGLWKTFDDNFRKSMGDDFTTELPSGRKLNYRNIQRSIRTKTNPETKKPEKKLVFTAEIGGRRIENYGGKLTENAVQGAARDVFGTHLLALEGNSGDVIWTSHDEAILEVDLDVKPRDVEEVMSVCPEWLQGCPIAAEAQESPCYKK